MRPKKPVIRSKETKTNCMSAMAMEVSIEPQKNYTYDVIIGDKFFLSTCLANNTRHDEQTLKDWIDQIQNHQNKKSKSKSKSKSRDLIVGLVVLHDYNFTNPPHRWLPPKASRKDDPYQLVILCAGTHCIILETVTEFGQNPRLDPVSPVLKDFLREITVVGIGIEKVAAKMEKDFGVAIPKRVELRDVLDSRLSEYRGWGAEEVRRLGLEEMSKIVLEGELELAERPRKIAWQDLRGDLSDDLIKYSTVDAFLASEMGKKLLNRT